MILCYHHGDLDGMCSAAIVIKRHGADNVIMIVSFFLFLVLFSIQSCGFLFYNASGEYSFLN
jgi:oligoribonuclease NrnB/cAMP/cGMP phosphodiesterase (DHH superfamily)